VTIVTIIIATVVGAMLLADVGLLFPFVGSVSDAGKEDADDENSYDREDSVDHSFSSSDSRYNVIEAACSTGSIITTEGTDDHDIMQGCDLEDILYGQAQSDILQGHLAIDKLFGNSGSDNLQGGAGGDDLYAGRGDDVIFGGFDDDFLVAGEGNDELYGETGNDILEGGTGADYFDCGDGLDVIIDFQPSKGDTHTNSCEDVREHL
jgi:Ca2+-binding RTX toxin-like protein